MRWNVQDDKNAMANITERCAKAGQISRLWRLIGRVEDMEADVARVWNHHRPKHRVSRRTREEIALLKTLCEAAELEAALPA